MSVDLIIDVKFLDNFCECARCAKSIARVAGINRAMENMSEEEYRLEKNLNGDLNEDPEEE